MHLDFITKDSPTKALDFTQIRVGDVIFADWKGDGIIDHTMLIRTKGTWYTNMYVIYRNAEGYDPQKNISLGSINNSKTVFHVYRPILYNEGGW